MFRIFSRGRKIPLEHIHPRASGAASLHEAKLAAWAIAIGEHRPSADPPYRMRRHHRGMLDDLPPPEPAPRRRPPSLSEIIEMIAGAILFGGRPAASPAGSLSGTSKAPVGEIALVPYIVPNDSRNAGDQAPADPASKTNLSRAA